MNAVMRMAFASFALGFALCNLLTLWLSGDALNWVTDSVVTLSIFLAVIPSLVWLRHHRSGQ